MSCFCHREADALGEQLQRLQQSTAEAANRPQARRPDTAAQASADQQAEAVSNVASWLSARALPAPPWQPDPKWLAAKLPTPRLGPGEMATLSLLGTLRKQTEALGIDLLQPEQSVRLNRMIATMNARVRTLAQSVPPPDAAPWQQLAARSEAADAVQQAAKAGLLDLTPEQEEAYAQPAGRPMQQWLPVLRQVRALAPLVAAASQLGVPLDAAEQAPERIGEAVRRLRGLTPPAPEEPLYLGRLSSMLSALGRLRQSLGVDPVEDGYAATEQMVAAKTAAAAKLLRGRPAPSKPIPYCPTTIAPPAVLQAAASDGMRKLADIGWKVPPADALPVLRNSLPATAIAGQLAALGQDPVRKAPCGQDCDAAKIMRAQA